MWKLGCACVELSASDLDAGEQHKAQHDFCSSNPLARNFEVFVRPRRYMGFDLVVDLRAATREMVLPLLILVANASGLSQPSLIVPPKLAKTVRSGCEVSPPLFARCQQLRRQAREKGEVKDDARGEMTSVFAFGVLPRKRVAPVSCRDHR